MTVPRVNAQVPAPFERGVSPQPPRAKLPATQSHLRHPRTWPCRTGGSRLPEHLRALVFILAFAGTIFFFAKKPVTELACTPEDFTRRRNLWIGLTLAAFLAHNIWL